MTINDKNVRYTVQAVILNKEGEVLGVSRKTDHNDFGLPGGKVDPEDETLENAIAREVMEETGLTINMDTAMQIFSMHKDGHMGYTYFIKDWSGEISTDEPHVVEWMPFQRIMAGSFGKWNSMVCASLESLGVSFVIAINKGNLEDDVRDYVESTIRKGYDKPFKFEKLSGDIIGQNVHITVDGVHSPDEWWDDFDKEYDNGLNEIAKRYGTDLHFPYYYYHK